MRTDIDVALMKSQVEQPSAPLDKSLLDLNEQIEGLNRLVSSLAQRLIPVRQPRDSEPAGMDMEVPMKDPRQSSAVVSSLHHASRRISDIADDVRTVLDDLEV